MIPVLFKEDEQVFSHNGIGALYESLSCDVIEAENGSFTMELEYPVDGEWFSEIKDFRIIQAKPNDIDEPHNFRIYEIVKSIDELTVYVRANTRTNDLGNNLITEYVGNNVTPQEAMTGMKSSLIEPTNFDLISDIQTRSNVDWTRLNPLNAIVGTRGSLVDIWGGQIKRTNTAIHLYSRRGRDNVVTIRPGKNIEGLNMTVSTAGLVTKILPTFTYSPVDVPKYQMITNSDGTKEKRRVTASGATTLRDDITVLGNVVSSQYVDNYPTNYWASVDYGDDDDLKDTVDTFIDTKLKHAEESSGIVNMSGFEQELKNFVKTELDKKAKQYFTHRNPGVDIPTVRIKVDMLQLSDSPDWEEFKDLERIGLTDTLDVWVEDYDIDAEVRVTSLTYDSIAEQVRNFNAGSDKAPRQSAMEKKYDDLTKATNDYITSFKNGVRNIMRNTADGLNRKFEGYTEPPAELSSEGDIWFKEIGAGKVEIWIYDGDYWQPVMTEDYGDRLLAEIETTQAELEEAKQQAKIDADQALAEATAHADAEDARIRGELEAEIGGAIETAEQAKQDAIDKANQALIDAKAHAEAEDARILQEIGLEVDGAIAIAEQAKADAISKANQALVDANAHADAEIALIGAHFDDILVGVESDVADAKQTADDAIFKIDNDIADKFTSLDAELVDIEAISNSAQENAQEALGDASTALDNAQTALNRADTAIGSASTALTKADEAKSSASGAVTKANEAKDAATVLGGKVSGFETTVAGFNQTVNNYTGQVSGFRNDILGLESTVADYATEVDEFGDTVSTYATQVSTLNNTVSGFNSTVATYGTAVTGYKNQVSTFNNTVSGFNSTVANYTTEVNELGEEVESYATEVATLTNTVSGFQSTVSKVEQDYEDVSGTVADHTTSISNMNGQIALKANTTTVSALTGRVTTAETGITANANAIKLKAATTTVNTLTGRVKTAETGITANANAIKLKASTTDVNTLTGRVTTAESSIKANATAITQRLTTTQVNTLVDGKGFAKETSVSTRFNDIQSTVDGTTQTIAKLRTDVNGKATTAQYNTLKSTVDGTVTRVGNAEGKITKIETNVSGLQTTVASKASQTQVTQLANGLSSVVTDLSNLEIGGRNLLLNSKKNLSGTSYNISTFTSSITFTPRETLTVTVKGNIKGSKLFGIYFDGVYYGTGGIPKVGDGLYSKQVNVPQGTTNKSVGLYLVGNVIAGDSWSFEWIKLEKGNKATDWTPAPEDVQSQITQNANNINLRVTKNDVVNQINVSTEGILIDGKKVHITGTTKIDNGVIKNAHIGNLDASKINAGTINAARLNSKAIVTAGLTANVIKSTHIETSTATVDKLFATDAMVNRLTAKTAFISSVKAVDIDAARITSGTIKAARLDAKSIVTAGLTADVIKSTHLETSTATITKLFATDAAVGTLTAKTAFINSIKAVDIDAARITTGTIKAARLDAKSIVTAGLTADVIKSTHLSADTAMFDKLFSTSSATDRLSARTAWIKNANIADATISGAKIANATISSAKIASLDVSKISGNTTSFVRSEWNNITRQVAINDTGINVTGHYNWRYNSLNETGLVLYGEEGSNYKAGAIGYFLGVESQMHPNQQQHVMYNYNNRHSISIGVNNKFDLTLGTSQSDWSVFNPSINIRGEDGRIEIHKNLMAGAESGYGVKLMKYNPYNYIGTAIRHFTLNHAFVLFSPERTILASEKLLLFTSNRGSTAFMADYKGINLDGNDIFNHSDRCLKTKITEVGKSSLETIKKIAFHEFDWIKNGRHDLGVIAQEVINVAPDLIDQSSDGYLSVNNTKLNMMTTHAVKELALRELTTNKIAKSNEEKIHQLQQELSKANRRIEELEGAMHNEKL